MQYELQVGLGDLSVLNGTDTCERPRITVGTPALGPSCPEVDGEVSVKDRDFVDLATN